jgi:hypothetical protein
MSVLEASAILFLAYGLVYLLVSRGELKWQMKPWFVKGPPNRGLFIGLFAFMLVIAIVHAVN